MHVPMTNIVHPADTLDTVSKTCVHRIARRCGSVRVIGWVIATCLFSGFVPGMRGIPFLGGDHDNLVQGDKHCDRVGAPRSLMFCLNFRNALDSLRRTRNETWSLRVRDMRLVSTARQTYGNEVTYPVAYGVAFLRPKRCRRCSFLWFWWPLY